MAERRMFAKTIIDSDAFLDMPLSTQSLYFHLSMRADDDGFINNPRKVQRMIGASDDDLRILIAKNFIIPFESGIVVIKHWKIHNYIQKDHYKETVYIEEKARLTQKKNKAYSLDTECIQDGDELDTECIQIGYTDKDRLVEDSRVKDKESKHQHGEFKNVLLTDKEYEKLKTEFPEAEEAIEFLSAYIAEKGYKSKSHYLAIRRWVINAVKERKGKTKGMMTKDTNISDLEKRLLAN